MLATILNKNPPLAQRRQNVELYNQSCGWQSAVGPTSAQRWQTLPTLRPTANVGPTAACYLGIMSLMAFQLAHVDQKTSLDYSSSDVALNILEIFGSICGLIN